MANLNNLKSGWGMLRIGYLSFGNVLNMAVNQIIYQLTAAVFWSLSVLRGQPGLMRFVSKSAPKNGQKKVLISFVLRPLYKTYFIGRIRYYFSINGLTLYLVKAFNELGYTCDVIHTADKNFKVKEIYSVAVFHVGNFEEVTAQLPANCIRIAFETGAYWRAHNAKELERLDELKQRRGVALSPDRWAVSGEQTEIMLKKVNAIIALGDYFTRETYKDFPYTYPIDSAYLTDSHYDPKKIENKNFAEAKKNFIYFGGGGAVHKGLDLLIETFSQLPNLELYLCCTLTPEFVKAYERELSASSNIHLIGYLPQRSAGFYQLMEKCAFNLHFSCSEGSPGGVIEVLQYGIIPIVSYESNIVVEGFGMMLLGHGLNEIKQKVIELSNLPNTEVKHMALATRQAGEERFTTQVFLKNLKYILKDQIKIP